MPQKSIRKYRKDKWLAKKVLTKRKVDVVVEHNPERKRRRLCDHLEQKNQTQFGQKNSFFYYPLPREILNSIISLIKNCSPSNIINLRTCNKSFYNLCKPLLISTFIVKKEHNLLEVC